MTGDPRVVSSATLHETVADWLLKSDGQLDETEQLANIVKVALMTDRRSDPEEILPDPDSTDRRGWWGDYQANEIWNGWDIGCKNWLLTRAKITDIDAFEGDTLQRAEQYTREALTPLISMRAASYIDVEVQRAELQRIHVTATVYRGPLPEIELRFQVLWDEWINPPAEIALIPEPVRLLVGAAAPLVITRTAPIVRVSRPVSLSPVVKNFQLTGNAPTIVQTGLEPQAVIIGHRDVRVSTSPPSIVRTGETLMTPFTRTLNLTTYAPTIVGGWA
jgi:phage gp46-like protein